MRQCPKYGKMFASNVEDRCNMSYGTPARKCDTVNVPYVEPEPEPEEDLREDLQGQSDQIHDLLEELGPLTYKELAEKLGVSPKRASNIVGTMIRDGVELKREGKPRKVSLG